MIQVISASTQLAALGHAYLQRKVETNSNGRSNSRFAGTIRAQKKIEARTRKDFGGAFVRLEVLQLDTNDGPRKISTNIPKCLERKVPVNPERTKDLPVLRISPHGLQLQGLSSDWLRRFLLLVLLFVVFVIFLLVGGQSTRFALAITAHGVSFLVQTRSLC